VVKLKSTRKFEIVALISCFELNMHFETIPFR